MAGLTLRAADLGLPEEPLARVARGDTVRITRGETFVAATFDAALQRAAAA